MSAYSQRFYMKNTSGTTQSCTIYSSSGECNTGGCMAVKVNSNTTGYVCLTTNVAGCWTSGRCKSTNGTTWAMRTDNITSYSATLITWNGTFTVPSGITKLRLTLVGGGAGGFVPNRESSNTNRIYGGVGGGTTWFGSVSAAGGTDSSIAYYGVTYSGEGGNYTYYYYNTSTASQSTGYYNGGYYNDNDSHSGGGSVPLTNYVGSVVGYAGAGGLGDGSNATGGSFPGASGYRTVTTVNVTPGQQIGYSIGGGGAGNRNGEYTTASQGGRTVGNGSAGAILLEYGVGIQ